MLFPNKLDMTKINNNMKNKINGVNVIGINYTPKRLYQYVKKLNIGFPKNR